MFTNNPIISVIMPVYNTEEYIKEAIESVINQTFGSWELICVNDGSTDNSLNILLDYEKMDSRIKVINQLNSGSAAAARNVALKSSQGLYLHFLDSDDFLSEDCLMKSYCKILKTNADLIMPDLCYFSDNQFKCLKILSGFLGDRKILLGPIQAFQASLDWKISGLGLFRMELVQKIKFDETGMNGDEYSTRLLFLNCKKIGFSDGVYYYRQHGESTTKKISSKLFDRLITDYRLLELAIEYNTGKKAIAICKHKIVKSIIGFQLLLTASEEQSILDNKPEIQGLIKKYYDMVDNSYFNGKVNFIQYVRNRIVFLNFNFLKSYAYLRVHITSNLIKILKR